jgi:hypothetical protein
MIDTLRGMGACVLRHENPASHIHVTFRHPALKPWDEKVDALSSFAAAWRV